MMKLLGGALIVLAAGWTGLEPVLRLRRRQRVLDSLSLAMELLRAELRSSLAPLPELFAAAARSMEGVTSSFFQQLAQDMRERPLATPMQLMRARLPILGLEPWECAILLELGNALGCYDLESQLRLLDAAQLRLQQAAEHCGKQILGEGRSWGTLGICTGLALAIVLV